MFKKIEEYLLELIDQIQNVQQVGMSVIKNLFNKKKIINTVEKASLDLRQQAAESINKFIDEFKVETGKSFQDFKENVAPKNIFADTVNSLRNFGDEIENKTYKTVNNFLGVEYAPKPDVKKDKKILADFAKHFYYFRELSDNLVKKNLSQGMVEICWPSGSHLGVGLSITNNGYFLTCYHCLNENLSEIGIKRDQELEPIKLLAYSKKHDLALAKIPINKFHPRALEYRFYDFSKYNKLNNDPIILINLWDDKLDLIPGIGGEIIGEEYFSSTIENRAGFSGSVVVSAGGEIIGLLSAGIEEDHDALIIPWKYALELILNFVYH